MPTTASGPSVSFFYRTEGATALFRVSAAGTATTNDVTVSVPWKAASMCIPKAMAGRVQDVARLVVDQYDGEPERLWTTAKTGDELLGRVSALPGFGAQKAQIFVALLGKQLGVQPAGWREAAGTFGAEGSHMSVADIVDADSLARVRSYKQGLKEAAKAKAAAKTS